ncbi:hypothetical protein BJ138DRAFT_1104616 [Hygrophoropsis aurantiaca]|uniref:Uncharacterized protein n=1 Tax=Hygrophoropsis aurantiaca TaxID=72124 RepID=A0ACB8A1N4_9AGAM|nr:hypothetical protein BJ138DRAFT_1104616 [Hygrophoropsis aurantiaca]
MSTPISAQEVQTPTPEPNQQAQPQAFLRGIDLPADFQLPPLDEVRGDAAKIAVFTRHRADADINNNAPWALACIMLHPDLFQWLVLAKPHDTPDDLREGCILTLKIFFRILQEGDEDATRLSMQAKTGSLQFSYPIFHGGVFGSRSSSTIDTFIQVMNAGHKLVDYLMFPEIDRPAEALPYLKILAEIDTLINTETSTLPWIRNPLFYYRYALALALSGSTDAETKLMLERAIKGLMQSDASSTPVKNDVVVTAEAKEFFRKNPDRFLRTSLKQALIRPGQPERHVLTVLGGPAWFDRPAKQTFKTYERADKMCLACGGCEPQKTLFRCSGCQHNWYCSKACQTAGWKTHKIPCREIGDEKRALEALRSSGSDNAQRKSDWMKWRFGPLGANPDAPFHALGLQRDTSRSRTHIIFFNAEYTPHASRDMMHKFRIESAGVYRISDVLPEIEASLGRKPGEGKEYIDGLFANIELNFVQSGGEPRLPATVPLRPEV